MSEPLRVPAVGELAPDFTLDSTAGSPITLSSFRGRQHVLIAFFPEAFTRVCTTELCAFSDDFDQFTSRDVTVLPISVDGVASLQAYKEKFAMRVELASDFHRAVSRAYGTLLEAQNLSNRAYFLVDKQGVLRWSFVEVHGGYRRENAELLAEIAKLG